VKISKLILLIAACFMFVFSTSQAETYSVNNHGTEVINNVTWANVTWADKSTANVTWADASGATLKNVTWA
jgi:hypothetical protein